MGGQFEILMELSLCCCCQTVCGHTPLPFKLLEHLLKSYSLAFDVFKESGYGLCPHMGQREIVMAVSQTSTGNFNHQRWLILEHGVIL